MRRIALLICTLIFCHSITYTQSTQIDDGEKRNMTFLDIRKMKRSGSYEISPDKQWLLYTITTPNWETAESQSDIYLVSATKGVSSTKQMTFTDEVSEKSPKWTKDGTYFVFLAKRDKDKKDQIYMMRPDGGGPRKITDVKNGVTNYEFSPDGNWLAYRSSTSDKQQLSLLPASELSTTEPVSITEQDAGVGRWQWSPDSKRIYFIGATEADEDNKTRMDKGFTVDVKNYETPLANLWAIDMDTKNITQLTNDDSYTVSNFNISDDSKWISYSGTSAERYERNITEQRINANPYLLNVATGSIEQLVNNQGVSESLPSFSPDSKMIAFTASNDMSGYNMDSRRCYIRSVDAKGQPFKKIGTQFPDHVGINFWSDDGKKIYFNTGSRATRQLFELDVEKDKIRQVTKEDAALSVIKDKDSGAILINYSDPTTPTTMYSVPSLDQVSNKSNWIQLTDVNPQTKNFNLGAQREITYTSTDGKEVAGILTLPVDYQPGKRYPLIVNIHGGPASADILRFSSGSVGQHVYAGKGYVTFSPNYRGSTNYGKEHRTAIVGNYFPQGYDDIMAGVDYLIKEGIVDGDKMGVKGWSAGGHWSNWILTHTDRFKAISSGAGTMNWLSMYAQSDVQRNRQFYLGDDLPYDNFEAYWDQSPIKYIKNAKTPTMIHVVAGDPRVPSPQSVELHMALKKLGVDTELFMYPGKSHGIPDTRNRLVKAMSEMAWMDYYVLGKGEKFSWNQVLNTLEEKKAKQKEAQP